MPERVYRDLTPGLCDVPDSTWAGATGEMIGEQLRQFSDLEDPESATLRELLQSQYIPPVTDEAREILAELAPDAIEMLEDQMYRNYVERKRMGRRTMPHHQQFEDPRKSD